MTNYDLFTNPESVQYDRIGPNSTVLRGFALPYEADLLSALNNVVEQAPFRHMVVRSGFAMSAAMTNCGELGWITDRCGYRYSAIDPESGQSWPSMPEVFCRLAYEAALAAGFNDFKPDSCLINRYVAGARMSLHQDKNERDFSAPIVSVSLGMTATFLFGGLARGDKAAKVPLYHGDVAVWGGADRLRYHGVMPLKDIPHPLFGSQRINLTFRKAG